MAGLDTVRTQMAAFLTAHGVRAVCAFPQAARSGGDGVIAAVSLRACEGGPSGFRDYLGERYNTAAGRWEELYGRRVRLTFGLDLYARKGADGGAAGIDRAFDTLAEAFHRAMPAGLKLVTLSCGETTFDPGAGLYQCPAEVVCAAYLYAVADEGGTFLDFTVRGEVQP